MSHNSSHRHTITQNDTTRNVSKSKILRGSKKLKQEMTELTNTATKMSEKAEPKHSSQYIYQSVSHINDSHHKYDIKYNVRRYTIYEPKPQFLAVVFNKAPRLNNLFKENTFNPTSAAYVTVSIYNYVYTYCIHKVYYLTGRETAVRFFSFDSVK